uniref:Uncharacterized protein n=1 Tax=Sinocyclocheilus anshuiensis TaxID=1608454 RepID=A0A671QJJ8_9TELE
MLQEHNTLPFKSLRSLHNTITQIQVPMLGFNYTFAHLCLLDDSKSCIVDDILRVLEEMRSAWASNCSVPILHYPITKLKDGREAYIGHQLGGVLAGGGRDGVRTARALQLTYYLQAASPLNEVVAASWELLFCKELENFGKAHPELSLYPFTSSSLQRDFQRTSRVSERPLLFSLAVCLSRHCCLHIRSVLLIFHLHTVTACILKDCQVKRVHLFDWPESSALHFCQGVSLKMKCSTSKEFLIELSRQPLEEFHPLLLSSVHEPFWVNQLCACGTDSHEQISCN